MPKASIQSFFDPATFTVTYVVADPQTQRAAIMDSVLDYDPKSGRTSHTSADKVIAFVKQAGLHVEWLLETHAHADHLSAAPYLQDQLGGGIGIGRHICTVQAVFKKVFNAKDMRTDGAEFDHLFEDGEEFKIGNIHVHDGVTEAEFVALRTARDKTLAMPVLILPAVQINVRAGHLPTAEDNGVSYLKIPINLL